MPLIATNQRRPTAPIELGVNRERVYFFIPSNPADPGSVHVAEVTEDDYDHLIKIEGYFAFRGTLTPAAAKPVAATAPAATPPAVAPEVVPVVAAAVAETQPAAETVKVEDPAGVGAAVDTTTTDEQTSAEIEAAAQALLSLSRQKLWAELDKGGIPTAVAQRALDIELAKPEVDQKLTFVNKLRAVLGAN